MANSGVMRAQVTLPMTTGLPRDVVVNTFHFITDAAASDATVGAAVRTQLTAFYPSTGTTTNVSGNLATALSRVSNACTIELTDVHDAQPVLPRYTTQFTIGAAITGAIDLPNETALCISYAATFIGGVPVARCRGRVYIGPLNAGQLGTTVGGRPNSSLVDTMHDAGEALMVAGSSTARWCVYSKVDDVARAVTSGWVDNEWDTQRRRGRAATTRQTF